MTGTVAVALIVLCIPVVRYQVLNVPKVSERPVPLPVPSQQAEVPMPPETSRRPAR